MKYLLTLIFIITFFLPWMVGQAASIPVDDEYKRLENKFEAEEISEIQLSVFQKKSQQQLKDFLNLVELISEEKYDSTFQEKMKEKALSFFNSPSDEIIFQKDSKSKRVPLHEFLKNSSAIKGIFPSSKISNLEFSKPILSKDKYTWSLSFQFSQKEISSNQFQARFILKKQKKMFGDQEKKVWQVFLNEIKEKYKGK